jgi:spatacsin
MIYICLDMIKPEELNYTNQTFDSTSFKSVKLTNVLRSLSKPSADSSESIKDRTEFLGKLVGLCNYGNKFSKRIKLDFQISNEILNVNFIRMLNENEWNLLKMILYSSHSNKFEIAREFVKIYDLNMARLGDFILEEILNTLNAYVQMSRSYGNAPSKPMILDPTNNDQFSLLIKIFDKDINMLGMKLLNKSRSILNSTKSTPTTADDYTIPTELLIRSHDCFIQSCSMEGISNVLQTCKLCAQRLEKAGEFNIMMRLLTGIAHFSEMTYIMDYLYNNNQCEMLVDKNMIKGTGKDAKLKLALLDYLKRNHPDDHATYTMVTLNFTMHREIATMLEEAAYQQLRILENKKLENTPESLTDLRSILQYFSDAAHSFMKEDCVKQTESCIKKARLVALQIHFLSSNLTIINLSGAQASKFVVNHPKFWEAHIVSEAYNKKSEWPQALFNQFVLNGNDKYLADFKTHLQLNANMIEEVLNRYRMWLSENKPSAECEDNIKKLLKHSKDIVQLYRLATSFEFKDLLEEMQTKNYSSIINDMIMNKKL